MVAPPPSRKRAADLKPGDVIRHECNTLRVIRLEPSALISFYVHVIAECTATGQREALMYMQRESVVLANVQS